MDKNICRNLFFDDTFTESKNNLKLSPVSPSLSPPYPPSPPSPLNFTYIDTFESVKHVIDFCKTTLLDDKNLFTKYYFFHPEPSPSLVVRYQKLYDVDKEFYKELCVYRIHENLNYMKHITNEKYDEMHKYYRAVVIHQVYSFLVFFSQKLMDNKNLKTVIFEKLEEFSLIPEFFDVKYFKYHLENKTNLKIKL